MNNRVILTIFIFFLLNMEGLSAQSTPSDKLAPTPPMGWMSWNYFADRINEKDIREMADAMAESGMVEAGYKYLFIDDGWQGGRDRRNNMIPDPQKFPSGMKSLADYVHSKGMKLGIYSNAAQLTCAGYTASLGFEEQDARTFASWGIDYLKYDYCHAPADSQTAKVRYKKMADALRKSGRDIVLGICEWGDRQPWLWAHQAGGQLWRISADVRDKWVSLEKPKNAHDLHRTGAGILDILDLNAPLYSFAGPVGWNDMDMLVIGLYGKKGPSGDLGGSGCTDIEYQSQMSLWCIMSAPLMPTNDIRNMNEETRRILLNTEMIAINQDPLGQQAQRVVQHENWNVFLKPLQNGDYALAILNRDSADRKFKINFKDVGLEGKYEIRDVWEHKNLRKNNKWEGQILSHETRVFRLKKNNG